MRITVEHVFDLIKDKPEIFDGLKHHIVVECLRKLPKNIHVLNAFADHALELKRHGRREYYGINCIQENLRWESYFQEEDEAYKILGIKKGCSKDEVIKAANSLQKKIHPDVNPNSNTERLSQIVNEAKETVLKDFS